MDFVKIRQQAIKGGAIEVFADYQNKRCKDLMVRAGDFYAMWDDQSNRWVEDEFDVVSTIDDLLFEYAEKLMRDNSDQRVKVRALGTTSGGGFKDFIAYIKDLPDMYKTLNPKITYAGDVTSREDYSTKNVPYFLSKGEPTAYHELVSTLYSPDERDKFEWAIGAILTGDVRYIQKFIVFYGGAGTGKSTVINIIERLFEGYCSAFKAADLTSRNNNFALEAFADNPMVAIQHDGDLSKIEDNTLLNSIVSHEKMQVNQKYKTPYDMTFNTFLFMGTNSPVKITDSKSGITRRLIDVMPTGNLVPHNRYNILMEHILDNELGMIANYCIEKYRNMGRGYYSNYKPLSMMYKTDTFYNYVSENYDDFANAPFVAVQRAYDMYKKYCEDTLVAYPMNKMKFKEELKSYFHEYRDRIYDKTTETQIRSVVLDFDTSKFEEFQRPVVNTVNEDSYISLTLDEHESLVDTMLADCPAQYANEDGFPQLKWDQVTTTLKDLDTTKLHYVKLPENHIVIDFDLKDENGKKSKELNLKAASKWPATYTEYSKSGGGIHLHYLYEGDILTLAPIIDTDIEVKRFIGNSSLRRRLSKCNNIEVQILSKELPKKEGKKMFNTLDIKNEQHIRALLAKALRKQIHDSTKPNIDFIVSVLTKAYESNIKYDVTDMKNDVDDFAMDSTNQREYCIKAVSQLHYTNITTDTISEGSFLPNESLYFYDIEVKPNLLLVCYKKYGSDTVTTLVNPTPEMVGSVIKLPLVGFNNKAYDNHIMYARYMGYSIEQCYELSKSMIRDNNRSPFYQGFKLGYADIYNIVPEKYGLKQWELELDIAHIEADVDWDAPATPQEITMLTRYCHNDVRATEAVWVNNKTWVTARQMLAAMTGGSMMDSTNALTQKLVFGDELNPQTQFNIPNLAEEFPGYEYSEEWVTTKTGANKKLVHSTYKGYDTGEGGFNYHKVGIWNKVKAFDVASMHPSSILAMVMFGEVFTRRFKELIDLRLLCKHGKLEEARSAFGGIFKDLLTSVDMLKQLANALKIAINSVYGMTYAAFVNRFRDERNKDNIVAKRGALFMIDLKEAVEAQGYTVVHIKTDCIKVAEADEFIEKFIYDFGQNYGYTFEVEEEFEKFALINAASYMGKQTNGEWDGRTLTFMHPYVWSKLTGTGFPDIADVRELKAVTGNAKIYARNENGDDMFVGKCGMFVPVLNNGYELLRKDGDKTGALSGTKGYRWMDWSVYKTLPVKPDINWSYYERLYNNAVDEVSKYGDINKFIA